MIGKCKSYFGDSKTTKLFFDNFKRINHKYHSLLLKSIDFNVKKMKEALISLESILSVLTSKEDKKLLLEMVLNDFFIEYLDRSDLDYLKEKLNGDYTNDADLKSKEFFLDILKHHKVKEMKKIGQLSLRKSYEYKIDNFGLKEYIYTVKDIMNKDFFSLKDAETFFDNNVAKELGCKTKDEYKNIKFEKHQSIEKIKNYSSYDELIKDIKLTFDLSEKNDLIYELTKEKFIDVITLKNFYDALPCWLPAFKKKNISNLLFDGFRYNQGFSLSLISEVDYFLRIKNKIPIKDIHNFNNFFNGTDKTYNIAEALLFDFNVRNKVCHGIFFDENLYQDSFIIYIIALDIFFDLNEMIINKH